MIKQIAKSAATFLIVTALCLFFFSFNSLAADVGGADISIGSVKSTAVSVNINENDGLMGFKITVTYPIDIIKVTSVDRGTVTKGGNFTTNTDTEGKIVVVWVDTVSVTKNGSLFNISFDVIDNTKSGTIRLSYSEDDTFNQNYETVKLNLKSIALKGRTAVPPTESEDTVPSPDDVVSTPTTEVPKQDYGLDTKLIGAILDKYELDNLTADQTAVLLKEVNDTFKAANRQEQFASVESLLFFYEQLKIFETQEKIESTYTKDEISNAVGEALENIGADNMSALTEEQKTLFSNEIKDILPDGSTNNLTDDEIFQIYDDYYSEKTAKTEGANKKTVIITVFSTIFVLAISAFIYILFRRRKK